MLPTKLNLLTNGTVADAVIRFEAHKFKDKIKSPSSSHEDEKELKEPDYDEDEDQLEQKREITSATTTNQVF